MKLIKYDNSYMDPFTNFDRWLDDAFFGLDRNPFFNRFTEREASSQLPVNLYEDNDNYYVTAELPGLNKKDVSIELENAVLTISGERKVKNDKDESTFTFSRSITVGDDVNAAKVKAKMQDGVLTVTLPRQEERKPRQITVS